MSSDVRRVHPAPPSRTNGRFASSSIPRSASICSAPGCGCTTWNGSASGASVSAESMSSGSASTTGPGLPGARGRERPREVLGDAVGAVDLRDPLRHRPEHVPEVDLLERLALDLVGGHLADQQNERRRVLKRGVHADRGVRRARAARDDGDARPAGELAVGVGHVRGAGLVTARDQADRRLVEAVEHGEEALARNAEHGVGAVDDELVDEQLAAVAAHSRSSR